MLFFSSTQETALSCRSLNQGANAIFYLVEKQIFKKILEIF